MLSRKVTRHDEDNLLREHVLNLLRGRGAHLNFDEVVKRIPENSKGRKLQGAPYTPWQLLEHMRIAQRDILEFSRDPKHISPEWPDGYWPQSEAPPDATAWDSSIKTFRKDLEAMQKLVEDPAVDLYARIPHGEGQTILREALLVADHNAYHLGQLVLLLKMSGET
jgi:DinB superfamily